MPLQNPNSIDFTPQMGRHKSTRWLNAVQPSYDGEDWDDDCVEEDEYEIKTEVEDENKFEITNPTEIESETKLRITNPTENENKNTIENPIEKIIDKTTENPIENNKIESKKETGNKITSIIEHFNSNPVNTLESHVDKLTLSNEKLTEKNYTHPHTNKSLNTENSFTSSKSDSANTENFSSTKIDNHTNQQLENLQNSSIDETSMRLTEDNSSIYQLKGNDSMPKIQKRTDELFENLYKSMNPDMDAINNEPSSTDEETISQISIHKQNQSGNQNQSLEQKLEQEKNQYLNAENLDDKYNTNPLSPASSFIPPSFSTNPIPSQSDLPALNPLSTTHIPLKTNNSNKDYVVENSSGHTIQSNYNQPTLPNKDTDSFNNSYNRTSSVSLNKEFRKSFHSVGRKSVPSLNNKQLPSQPVPPLPQNLTPAVLKPTLETSSAPSQDITYSNTNQSDISNDKNTIKEKNLPIRSNPINDSSDETQPFPDLRGNISNSICSSSTDSTSSSSSIEQNHDSNLDGNIHENLVSNSIPLLEQHPHPQYLTAYDSRNSARGSLDYASDYSDASLSTGRRSQDVDLYSLQEIESLMTRSESHSHSLSQRRSSLIGTSSTQGFQSNNLNFSETNGSLNSSVPATAQSLSSNTMGKPLEIVREDSVAAGRWRPIISVAQNEGKLSTQNEEEESSIKESEDQNDDKLGIFKEKSLFENGHEKQKYSNAEENIVNYTDDENDTTNTSFDDSHSSTFDSKNLQITNRPKHESIFREQSPVILSNKSLKENEGNDSEYTGTPEPFEDSSEWINENKANENLKGVAGRKNVEHSSDSDSVGSSWDRLNSTGSQDSDDDSDSFTSANENETSSMIHERPRTMIIDDDNNDNGELNKFGDSDLKALKIRTKDLDNLHDRSRNVSSETANTGISSYSSPTSLNDVGINGEDEFGYSSSSNSRSASGAKSEVSYTNAGKGEGPYISSSAQVQVEFSPDVDELNSKLDDVTTDVVKQFEFPSGNFADIATKYSNSKDRTEAYYRAREIEAARDTGLDVWNTYTALILPHVTSGGGWEFGSNQAFLNYENLRLEEDSSGNLVPKLIPTTVLAPASGIIKSDIEPTTPCVPIASPVASQASGSISGPSGSSAITSATSTVAISSSASTTSSNNNTAAASAAAISTVGSGNNASGQRLARTSSVIQHTMHSMSHTLKTSKQKSKHKSKGLLAKGRRMLQGSQ